MNSLEIDYLKALLSKGGPGEEETPVFTDIVNNISEKEIDQFRDIIRPSLNENTLIGHAYLKPFGYPGDFKVIHNIYKKHVNPNPQFSNWDRFFQSQAGAMAVRNRKKYFIEKCQQLEKLSKDPCRVLILGSGPATDVNEYLVAHPQTKIIFDLIDFDQNAINFARQQNESFNGSVEYFRINVLRYKPFKMYDLIWSAGLFDYFKDKHFVYMIRKYANYIAENGEFIIGNFSTNNPTKRLMEVLSDWYLNHRSSYDLVKLAIEADIAEERISIDKEQLGVNLFLKIKHP